MDLGLDGRTAVVLAGQEIGHRGIRTATVTPGPGATGEAIACLVTLLASDRTTSLRGTGLTVEGGPSGRP